MYTNQSLSPDVHLSVSVGVAMCVVWISAGEVLRPPWGDDVLLRCPLRPTGHHIRATYQGEFSRTDGSWE